MSDRSDQSDADPAGSDRRRALRHLACFPALLTRDNAAGRQSLIRDLSVTGALLVTRARFEVGEEVTLQLHLGSDADPPVAAVGRVVRSAPLGPEEAGLWSRTLAVQFDRPLTEYEAQIKAIADRQAEVAAHGTPPVESE
jgi:hypothetical protein